MRGFPLKHPGSRPSYLRPAPTLLRLNHLADLPGTEASPPEAAELPRLVNVVEMEVRSLAGVHLPRLAHTGCPGTSSPGIVVAAWNGRAFRGQNLQAPPLPIRAAVRGSAPSLPSLTGKPSRASHG